MDLTKEEAIKIVLNCARLYFHNLNNRDFLFIVGTVESHDFFEVSFTPRNFMHLTGMLPAKGKRFSPADFFNACMTNRLSPKEIELADDGTSEMKLRVLPSLMALHKSARMAGDFSPSGIKLYTEKLVGGIYGCMGFVANGDRYVPNTALNYDIRNITRNRQRILAIFRKPTFGSIFTDLCYLAQGVHLQDLSIPGTYVVSVPNEEGT